MDVERHFTTPKTFLAQTKFLGKQTFWWLTWQTKLGGALRHTPQPPQGKKGRQRKLEGKRIKEENIDAQDRAQSSAKF